MWILTDPEFCLPPMARTDSTVHQFKHNLLEQGGDPGAIEEMCCDMSPAFIRGIEKQFPATRLTFDKFYVIKILNDAVDQVRREELKERSGLKGPRYIWLKNQSNLIKPLIRS